MSEMCKCTRDSEIATATAERKTLFKEIESLKNMQNAIYDLGTNIALLVQQMKETKEDVASIKKDVENIKTIPTSNYQYYTKLIMGAIIGGVVGYIVKGWF